jgi:hypothetical protein
MSCLLYVSTLQIHRYTQIRTYTHIFAHAHKLTNDNICVYDLYELYACTYVCMYACMHVHICTCMCMLCKYP